MALCWVDEFLSRSKIETIFQFNIHSYFISFAFVVKLLLNVSWTFLFDKNDIIWNMKIWFYLNDRIIIFDYQQIHLKTQTLFETILKRNSNENLSKWKVKTIKCCWRLKSAIIVKSKRKMQTDRSFLWCLMAKGMYSINWSYRKAQNYSFSVFVTHKNGNRTEVDSFHYEIW